jgi:hypothetical protein
MNITHCIKLSLIAALFGHGGNAMAADDCKVPRIDCDMVANTQASPNSIPYSLPKDIIAISLDSGSALSRPVLGLGAANQFNNVDLNQQGANNALGSRFETSTQDPIDLYGVNKDLNGDSLYGAYVRRKLPVGDSVELSGAVGYSVVERNRNEKEGESDVSYGIGTGFRITDDVSLSVDYVEYVEESDYEHTEINLGVKGRF